MSNILDAIKTIVGDLGPRCLNDQQIVRDNRANQMGYAFEEYVKNAFADCMGKDRRATIHAHAKTFSYIDNGNNPPDLMIRGGDAIEIKKIKTLGTSQLQLNSSYPKNKLYSDNPKISRECKECEQWDEKDMLYIVGHVDESELKTIFFIYGDLYCDSRNVYEKVENVVKEGLQTLDVGLAETNELGRVNGVDHLGISDLRVRGMWLIKTPFQQFNYLHENITDYQFKLVALIPKDKYLSFNEDVFEFEEFCEEKGVSIIDERIQDPQNPAHLIDTKLVIYSY